MRRRLMRPIPSDSPGNRRYRSFKVSQVETKKNHPLTQVVLTDSQQFFLDTVLP